MRLTQDNEVVKALVADRPFGESIPPRRGGRNRLVPYAHGAQATRDNGCPYRKLNPNVVMMKPAENGERFDASVLPNHAGNGRIFVQRPMSADFIIAVRIRLQNPTQMRLAKDDQVINAFATDRPDKSFGKSVLPWRRRRGRLVPDTHGAQAALDERAIDAIAIAEEIARSLVPWERFRDLARNPFRSWVSGDADPDKRPSVKSDDHERVKQVKGECRDDKEIHRSDIREMVAQKRAPSLARRPPPLDHVFSDRRLGNVESELQKFAMDARSAP